MPLLLDSEGHRIPLAVRMQIAEFLQAAGCRPKVFIPASARNPKTNCVGVGITAGYGRLSEFGDWEFPLL